jgi:hypothetical protein
LFSGLLKTKFIQWRQALGVAPSLAAASASGVGRVLTDRLDSHITFPTFAGIEISLTVQLGSIDVKWPSGATAPRVLPGELDEI